MFDWYIPRIEQPIDDMPKKHINEEILDSSEPTTNTEVTDSSEHLYDTFCMHCLLGVGAQVRVVSRFNMVAPLPGLKTIY